ncbi:MAG: hypothetical protein KTR18_07590 [Acidiferrobacterales bacterium]|nr:hypothetical protein [Acidiferrobacterales bacterium]
MSLVSHQRTNYFNIDESRIAASITPFIKNREFPDSISLPDLEIDGALSVEYTLDADLQGEAERLLRKYNPDYGVLVALDPDTGEILALADSTRNPTDLDHLALSATYPAASVSKIITAVAGFEQGVINTRSVIPFNGKSTTLYKKNVFRHKDNKWTRKQPFSESFAKSVNAVFGRLGAVTLGGETLQNYFYQLGFNARFASDLQFDNGSIELDTEDEWQVAEAAAGYTRRNTLSPVHGAALAASAVNGGHLIAPVLVSRVTGPQGIPLYHYSEPAVSPAMSAESATKLQTVMRATVAKGSARKSFRRFNRKHLEEVQVGGKTGSLTGFSPKGKYDWFVGFGKLGDRKIAFAALCINKEKWYVKSARLARELLEFHFRPDAETAES